MSPRIGFIISVVSVIKRLQRIGHGKLAGSSWLTGCLTGFAAVPLKQHELSKYMSGFMVPYWDDGILLHERRSNVTTL